jgi:hypothetical protein
MIHLLLTDIICRTFEKEIGKRQSNNHDECYRNAMLISFSAGQDKEDNYLSKELAIYGHNNYVQVWERSVANRFLVEAVISDWIMLVDHDSEWRSCIGSWLFNNRDELQTFNFNRSVDWYKKIPWKFKKENEVENKTLYL